MRKFLAVAAVSLVVNFWPFRTCAGPDAVTQGLIDDSPSMLDFGIFQLNLRLSRDELGVAYFDWDRNSITIATSKIADTEDAAEKVCAEWIKSARTAAGIGNDGNPVLLTVSYFGQYFEHNGFARKSEPDDLRKELDKRFSLSCFGISDGKTVAISAPLLGNSYSVEKK